MSSELVISDVSLSSSNVLCLFRINLKIKLIKKEAFLNSLTANYISVIVSNVDDIETNTFQGCNLRYIELPGIDYESRLIFGDQASKDALSSLEEIAIVECSRTGGAPYETKLGSTFSGLSSLRRISFPSTLKEFNANALTGCNNLTKLKLLSGVHVNENAFIGIVNLNELQTPIPNNVNDIGIRELQQINSLSILKYDDDYGYSLKENIVKGSTLKKLAFLNNGAGLTAIEPFALSGLALNEDNLNLNGASLENLSLNAFSNVSLNSLYLNSMDAIPSKAFELASILTVYFNEFNSIATDAFHDANVYAVILTNDSLTSIQKDAFRGCVQVSVLVGNGDESTSLKLKRMEPHGAGTMYLQRIVNNSLTSVAPSGFMYTSIADDKIDTTMALKEFGEWSFANMGKLSSAMINSALSYLPEYCFANNYELANVTLGPTILKICANAFFACLLQNLTLNCDDGQMELLDEALLNVNSLTSFDLNKVSKVGNSALKNCRNINYNYESLKNIVKISEDGFCNAIMTGGNVLHYVLSPYLFGNIERNAFNGCRFVGLTSDISLEEFNSKMSADIGEGSLIPEPRYDSAAIASVYAKIKDYFGIASDFELLLKDFTFNASGSGNDYKCFKYVDESTKEVINAVSATQDWENFKKKPIIPSKAKKILKDAFNVSWFRDELTSINLNNVSEIEDEVLSRCSNVLSVVAPNLAKAGKKAFSDCTKLKYLSIPKLQDAGDELVVSDNSLPNVYAPYLQKIGIRAFSDCNLLTSVNVEKASDIGISAFSGNNELLSVAFSTKSSNLNYIRASMFNGCPKIKKIEIPASLMQGNESLQHECLKNAGNSLLSVSFIGKSQAQVAEMLLLNNDVAANVGTKFYTEDFAYHSFLVTNANSIYKVPHAAFDVEILNGALTLVRIENSKLPHNSGILDSSVLNGLYVETNAAKECTNLVAVYLNSSNVNYIKENAFANTYSGLRLITLDDVDLNSLQDLNLRKYLNWTGTSPGGSIDSCGDKNVVYQFRNGTLRHNGSKWTFSSDNDVFIEDTTKNGRIAGVNDTKALSFLVIPTNFAASNNAITAIGAGSLSTTHKIGTLDVGTSLRCIESDAFKGNYSISNLIMDKDGLLEQIGRTAFRDCALRTVYIPYNSTRPSIEGYGLNSAFFLTKLTYGEGLTSVAPSAMIDCIPLLSDLTLPTSLKRIGDYAFAETHSFHPSIRKVNLSELTNLTSIGDYAFYNSLVTMTDDPLSAKMIIPKKVKTIGAAAFGYNDDAWILSLSSIEFYNDLNTYNVEDIGPSAFIRHHFRNVSFHVGNRKTKLTSIGDYAFAYPKYKYSMCIPSSICEIGVGAFKRNIILNPDAVHKNILSVDLNTSRQILSVLQDPTAPNGIALCSLNDSYEANNSISVTDDTVLLATKGDYKTSFIYALNNKLNLCPEYLSIDIISRKIVSADNSIVSAFIPRYVNTIGERAFLNCVELTAVSSVNEYLNIESSAFYNCPKLIGINIDKIFRLSAVNPYSFYDCRSLENIRLTSSAVSVGDYAFYNCSSTTSFLEIVVEEKKNYTLSAIGSHSFENCSSISTFFIPSNISVLGDDPFKGCTSMKTLTVNIDSTSFRDLVDNYGTMTVGEAVSAKFNSIRNDGSCYIMFNDCVYMNNGNIKIDNEYVSFRYLDRITAVSAFDMCKYNEDEMTYLNLSNVSEVDLFVFRGAKNMEMVNFLPGSLYLSSIGQYSFSKCSNLMSFCNNNVSVSFIGRYAFAECNLMNVLTFDGDLLSCIEQGAFYGTSIEKLVFNVDFIRQGMVADDFLAKLKLVIRFDEELNPNPLELPDDAILIFKDKTYGTLYGKYDYMLNDLLNADIDINRNLMTFIDKRKNAIKPLLLVKPGNKKLPAIVNNLFHMSVIGRWK